MKNIDPVFLGNWNSSEDIFSDFGIKESDLEGGKIIFGFYNCQEYEGYASVIIQMPDDSLKLVHGSHCSCYGLEDQWDMEDISVVLLNQMKWLGNSEVKEKLNSILDNFI